MVSETFARRFFGNEDPIGKHFGRKLGESREFEIVGVARDARYFARGLDRPSGPLFFLPEAQAEYSQTSSARCSCATSSLRPDPTLTCR